MINMLAAFRADNMKRAEQAGNEITQQQHRDMGIKLCPKTALARAGRKRWFALLGALGMLHSTVTVVKKLRNNGKSIEQEVPIQKLNVGDDIIVPAGAIIPVDGVVIGGSSIIDACVRTFFA